MKKYFRGGSIVVVGKYHEEVIYDVLSNDLQVTFDGKGGIAECTSNTQTGAHALTSTASVYSGKKKIDAFCEKSVKMIGRTQTIVLKTGDVRITIYQFVPAEGRAIFCEISANKAGDYDFVLDLDHRRTTRFDFAANVESRFVPESALLYVHTNKRARLVLSCGTDAAYCRRLLSRFAEFEKQVEDEIASVKVPATAKTEKDKAVYTSSYFCALENYMESGDYKCFSEGVDRTYFRDSYWTVLPMYKSRPDLVRCQILTLAHGIEENGDCPAAVTVEWNPFFRNQYDSPSFFVLMVYDYINHTGDFSILDETVRGRTVFDWCALAVDKLALYEDETHLIVKAGPHNNRDWANDSSTLAPSSASPALPERATPLVPAAIARCTNGPKPRSTPCFGTTKRGTTSTTGTAISSRTIFRSTRSSPFYSGSPTKRRPNACSTTFRQSSRAGTIRAKGRATSA